MSASQSIELSSSLIAPPSFAPRRRRKIPAVRLAWFTPLPPVTSGVAQYSVDALPGVLPTHDGRRVRRVGGRALLRARTTPPRPLRSRLRLAAPEGSLRPGGVPARERRLPRFHVALPLSVPRASSCSTMRTCTTPAPRACCRGAARGSTQTELVFNHPEVPPERAAIGVAGFGGPISYFWPMLRSVVLSARRVAVHNAIVADELRDVVRGRSGRRDPARRSRSARDRRPTR